MNPAAQAPHPHQNLTDCATFQHQVRHRGGHSAQSVTCYHRTAHLWTPPLCAHPSPTACTRVIRRSTYHDGLTTPSAQVFALIFVDIFVRTPATEHTQVSKHQVLVQNSPLTASSRNQARACQHDCTCQPLQPMLSAHTYLLTFLWRIIARTNSITV